MRQSAFDDDGIDATLLAVLRAILAPVAHIRCHDHGHCSIIGRNRCRHWL